MPGMQALIVISRT